MVPPLIYKQPFGVFGHDTHLLATPNYKQPLGAEGPQKFEKEGFFKAFRRVFEGSRPAPTYKKTPLISNP
jgi:hypothetical protein